MTAHRLGSREEWLAARKDLLEQEKELTRRSDELAQRRRELPWVPVEKEYPWQLLDRAPNGRGVDMDNWLRRHDEYEDAEATTAG